MLAYRVQRIGRAIDRSRVIGIVHAVEGSGRIVGIVRIQLVKIEKEGDADRIVQAGLQDILPDKLGPVFSRVITGGLVDHFRPVEPPVESPRLRFDRYVVDNEGGVIALPAKDFRQIGDGLGQLIFMAHHSVHPGIKRAHKRCHRGSSPGGLGERLGKVDTLGS